MKTYSELITLPTFEERFNYLKLSGSVGFTTFGHDRYLNQMFYNSPEWRRVRRDVIARDEGCDLAIPDRPLNHRILIHHINPITVEDVIARNFCVFDPENLVCTSFNTHEAIHYSSEDILIPSVPLERKPNDQSPWRKEN